MAVFFLCTFALHASVAVAGKHHWSRRLSSCNPPPPMTYVIGLDASKSMGTQGWSSAVHFANTFIDFALQGQSEVLLYYFNGSFCCMPACMHWSLGELDGDCTLSAYCHFSKSKSSWDRVLQQQKQRKGFVARVFVIWCPIAT